MCADKRKRRAGIRRVRDREASGPQEELRLVQYEITPEPLPDYPPMAPEVADQYEELYHFTFERPAEAVGRLEALRERYPDERKLDNLLINALSLAGEAQKADALIEESYRRHPDYLFAKLNYANLCLSRGDVDAVLPIFGGSFDLSSLYPDRRVYHVSEMVGFFSLMARYQLLKGDVEAAEACANVLEEIAPDHPTTKALMDQLALDVLEKAMRGLVRMNSRPGRRRRRAAPRKRKQLPPAPEPRGPEPRNSA